MLPQQAKILDEMLKRPENRDCADCGARGPRWVSTNLGVFICIRCSGIHRSLGTHITKVKSVNLDKWTQEQLDYFSQWGNARAKEVYENTLPSDFRRPNESDSFALEAFIRDKYEKKRWMAKQPASGAQQGGQQHGGQQGGQGQYAGQQQGQQQRGAAPPSNQPQYITSQSQQPAQQQQFQQPRVQPALAGGFGQPAPAAAAAASPARPGQHDFAAFQNAGQTQNAASFGAFGNFGAAPVATAPAPAPAHQNMFAPQQFAQPPQQQQQQFGQFGAAAPAPAPAAAPAPAPQAVDMFGFAVPSSAPAPAAHSSGLAKDSILNMYAQPSAQQQQQQAQQPYGVQMRPAPNYNVQVAPQTAPQQIVAPPGMMVVMGPNGQMFMVPQQQQQPPPQMYAAPPQQQFVQAPPQQQPQFSFM